MTNVWIITRVATLSPLIYVSVHFHSLLESEQKVKVISRSFPVRVSQRVFKVADMLMLLPNADHLRQSLPFTSIGIPLKRRWQAESESRYRHFVTGKVFTQLNMLTCQHSPFIMSCCMLSYSVTISAVVFDLSCRHEIITVMFRGSHCIFLLIKTEHNLGNSLTVTLILLRSYKLKLCFMQT